jgi:hypothetical protein
MSLETIMRRLYQSEINFTISVFWDGGFNVSSATMQTVGDRYTTST